MRSFLFIAFCLVHCAALSQDRYFDPIFPVGTTYDIPYSKVKDRKGRELELKLDIYEPLNDHKSKRPLIIMAHGGGFVVGNKNNYSMETICTRFAQMGYVTASIDYRMGFDKKGDPNELAEETVRKAVEDLLSSISYLRTPAAANSFKIDTNFIILGGSSAGAVMALHTVYGNQTTKSSEYLKGVVALCGAIKDTAMIDRYVPCFLAHGTEDPIVPFGDSKIRLNIPLVFSVPPADVQGSIVIDEKMTQMGVPHALLRFENAGHCPFDRILEKERYPLYMDMTINGMRNFLFNQFWNRRAARSDMSTPHASQIYLERDSTSWSVYPVDKNVMKVKVIVQDTDRNTVLKKTIKKKLKRFEKEIVLKSGDYRTTMVYNGFSRTFYFKVD